MESGIPNRRSYQLRCEWCGAAAPEGSVPSSSLSDRDLLLRYYGGQSRGCNQQTWAQRRDLFDRAAVVLGREPAL